jgi:hypothetical protein
MYRTCWSRSRGRRAAAIAAAVAMAGGGIWLAAPAASAVTSPAPCQVTDQQTHAVFSSLQAAVDAAAVNQALTVIGTCTGPTEIAQNLSITGKPTLAARVPTLTGGGAESTVTVDLGATVTITGLTITGGGQVPADSGLTPPFSGGGVENYGTLTLDADAVVNNIAQAFGGGIWTVGDLTVKNTLVRGNTLTESGAGAGIYSAYYSLSVPTTLTLTGLTVVSDNSGSYIIGAGIAAQGATTVINGLTVISGNTTAEYYGGGGIYNESAMTIGGDALITGNTGGGDGGGGIANAFGSLTITGNAAVIGNTSDSYGGGIYNQSTLVISGNALISGNTAETYGGGIFNGAGLTFSGRVAVTGNTADVEGGGITEDDSDGLTPTVTGTATVSGNKPDDTYTLN